jgi:hypothetical protein
VAHSPERPFVPRRTPTQPQPAIGSADFMLSRPFVPAADRERVGSYSSGTTAEDATERFSSLPPIESFMEPIPSTAPGKGSAVDEELFADSYAAEDEELPPVEHLIDPLPAVDDFAAAHEGNATETDWVETDWQQYDWRAAAALGDTGGAGDAEASTAWASTDWDAGMQRTRESRPTPAQAIAIALDQIAERIRNGELPMPSSGPLTDPRTIAATLAALLGIRQ